MSDTHTHTHTHNTELSGGKAVCSDELLADVIRERDELRTQLDSWHRVFGTSQLSHAQARLEAAEDAVRRLSANGKDETRND